MPQQAVGDAGDWTVPRSYEYGTTEEGADFVRERREGLTATALAFRDSLVISNGGVPDPTAASVPGWEHCKLQRLPTFNARGDSPLSACTLEFVAQTTATNTANPGTLPDLYAFRWRLEPSSVVLPHPDAPDDPNQWLQWSYTAYSVECTFQQANLPTWDGTGLPSSLMTAAIKAKVTPLVPRLVSMDAKSEGARTVPWSEMVSGGNYTVELDGDIPSIEKEANEDFYRVTERWRKFIPNTLVL